MKTLKTMKKLFLYLNFSIAALFHLSTTCTEKNWLQGKLDAFTHKMVTRHTYKHNSFEHMRDRALLFLLPPSIAQGVLTLQRNNMKNFLKHNEENALENVRKYFNVNEQKWTQIINTFHQEHNFNLSQMKENDNNSDAHHSQSLSAEWITAITHECNRYGINSKKLNLEIAENYNEIAHAREERPYLQQKYIPATIALNMTINRFPQYCLDYVLPSTATHEFTHLVCGHSLRNIIIVNEIIKNDRCKQMFEDLQMKRARFQEKINSPFVFFHKINPFNPLSTEFEQLEAYAVQYISDQQICNKLLEHFIQSTEYGALHAAQEKTSDTLISCIDRQVAKNAYMTIKHLKAQGYRSYPQNHNDINVIHSNWQTSQAIKDYQQLRSSIKQKLNAFPKFFV